MNNRRVVLWALVWVVGLLAGYAAAGEWNTATATTVEERLKDIEREVGRLREAGQPAKAGELEGKIKYFRERLEGKAKSEQKGAELHVVGVYEGAAPAGGGRGAGVAMVEVGATDRPVVLALCAYDRVRWEVKAAQGAKLQKVIVSGYHEQRLEKAPEGVVVEQRTQDGGSREYFYAYSRDHEAYPQAVRTLKALTGLEVATFQGAYRYPGWPFVIGPENEEWMAQRVLAELEPTYREAMAFERARQREAFAPMRFKAIRWTGRDARLRQMTGEFGEFTPAGPIAGTLKRLPERIEHLAVDPRGPTYYGMDDHGVYRVDMQTGQKTELAIKDFDLPKLSWACGLAFDTKRGRLVVSSLGGEGFLYAYAPEQAKWSVLSSLKNVDLMALTYSAEEDCFYGLGMVHQADTPMVIHQYDANGQSVKQVRVLGRVPVERGGERAGYQLACVGRQVALLTPLLVDASSAELREWMYCFLIDLKTGALTYRGAVDVQPGPSGRAMEPGEMDAMWERLRGEDRVEADAAMWKLAGGGDRSVAFLKSKLRPAEARDTERVGLLVAKLDHDDFRVREEAGDELVRMGGLADAELRKRLRGELSPEAQTRIAGVLRRMEEAAAQREPGEVSEPGLRREARAAWVLARIGTPAAVQCLVEWAKEGQSVRAGQAKAALKWLGRG